MGLLGVGDLSVGIKDVMFLGKFLSLGKAPRSFKKGASIQRTKVPSSDQTLNYILVKTFI